MRDLWDRREFAWYLAMGNLKARNASTALGLLWWVLNPMLLGGVYWLVFGVIFDRGELEEGVSFLAYLLSGMFPFFFTQSSMTAGVNSIVSNTKLLANLRFPRLVLPLSALMESLVGFLTSILVFYLIAGPISGVWPSHTIIWLLPLLVIHVVFNFGLSTVVARVAVPFRDLNNLVPYLTRLWLYLSPIIYPASFIVDSTNEWVRRSAGLNPLVSILGLYRYALVGEAFAIDLASAFLNATLWATGVALLGVVWFIRYEGKMARYL